MTNEELHRDLDSIYSEGERSDFPRRVELRKECSNLIQQFRNSIIDECNQAIQVKADELKPDSSMIHNMRQDNYSDCITFLEQLKQEKQG